MWHKPTQFCLIIYIKTVFHVIQVSLPVSEYQELKAQAALASLADGDSPGAKEGGAAGEVWMRLDQKNKVGVGPDANHSSVLATRNTPHHRGLLFYPFKICELICFFPSSI